jgi:hypothetical protein
LELRLFQYFLVHTCSTISVSVDYWRIHVPQVASEHRHVFEGVLALAALHLYRQTDNGIVGRAHRAKDPPIDNEGFLADATSADMLRKSIDYLHSAIRGHQQAFTELSYGQDPEAVYLSSVMILIVANFLLGVETSIDGSVAPFDEAMWLRLGVGPRE